METSIRYRRWRYSVKFIMNTREDTNQPKLPPFEVTHVVSSLSQVKGWGLQQLNVPKTWTITKGKGVVVMVIDTGFCDHVDLEGAMNKKASRTFSLFERDITDQNGHSSHCCGIIGARDNATGMVGVAPECTIITCKVLDKNGTGSTNAVNDALRYAKEIKPDVISMSLGSPQYDKVQHDLIKELYNMNIPIIAAAGNDGRSNAVNYPGKYEETICVTAFDERGRPARFNSTGDSVDFSAPGVRIYSTYLNNRYAELSGTSMATPFIAGLVALLIAKHKKQELETGENDCVTVAQIKEHLIKYADDRGVVGRDPIWGYGVIEPAKLISSFDTQKVIVDPEIPETPETPETSKKSLWYKIKRFFKKIF